MSSPSSRSEVLPPAVKRVAYTNVLDGQRRVLIGNLTETEAAQVAREWGDPRRKFYYLGPVQIEDCDGTPDGDVIRSTPRAPGERS